MKVYVMMEEHQDEYTYEDLIGLYSSREIAESACEYKKLTKKSSHSEILIREMEVDP